MTAVLAYLPFSRSFCCLCVLTEWLQPHIQVFATLSQVDVHRIRPVDFRYVEGPGVSG